MGSRRQKCCRQGLTQFLQTRDMKPLVLACSLDGWQGGSDCHVLGTAFESRDPRNISLSLSLLYFSFSFLFLFFFLSLSHALIVLSFILDTKILYSDYLKAHSRLRCSSIIKYLISLCLSCSSFSLTFFLLLLLHPPHPFFLPLSPFSLRICPSLSEARRDSPPSLHLGPLR